MEEVQASAGAERDVEQVPLETTQSLDGRPHKRVCLPSDSTSSPPAPIYRRLSVKKKEIRVLHVQPADRKAAVQCTLHTIRLHKASFSAISYLWGASHRKELISLNGQEFAIGYNAFTALSFIRNHCKDKHIWIDSVCVNQEDLDERNQQVSLMGEIYSMARPVWLWTGKTTRHVKTFNRIFLSLEQLMDDDIQDLDYDSEDGQFLTSLDNEEWQSIAEVLCNPFWHRIWTLQEIIMAAARDQAMVLFGTRGMIYQLFSKIVRWLLKANIFLVNITPTKELDEAHLRIERAGKSFYGRERYQEQYEAGDLNNLNLLKVNSSMKATDPRDRVYGLLALMRTSRIRADYNKSVADVYREATLEYIEDDKSLDIFAQCNSTLVAGTAMPSWTINWDAISQHGASRGTPPLDSWLYDAFAGSNELARPRYHQMAVLGFRLFRLKDMVQYHPDHVTSSWLPGLAEVQKWVVQRVVSDGRTTETHALETFMRTLLFDRAMSGIDRKMRRLGTIDNFNAQGFFLDIMDFWVHISNTANGYVPDEGDEEEFQAMVTQHMLPLDGAKFSVGPAGECCLLGPQAEEGDVVFIVSGCRVPLVLRPIPGVASQYQVVGGVYVHGNMDGEAVAEAPRRVSTGDPDCVDEPFEVIVLV